MAGRSLPGWVTGLAFIAANLGATEILGMAANGAEFGVPTVHYYWIGAVPAMVFLGLMMMPFYYGSRIRSVPEFLLRRFGRPAHLWQSLSFAAATMPVRAVLRGVRVMLLMPVPPPHSNRSRFDIVLLLVVY